VLNKLSFDAAKVAVDAFAGIAFRGNDEFQVNRLHKIPPIACLYLDFSNTDVCIDRQLSNIKQNSLDRVARKELS